MTYPGSILRGLAALALAAPVACTIDNQAFMFGTDGDATGSAGTSTTGPTTGVSSLDTGVDTGPPNDVGTAATGDPSISTSGPTSDVTSDAGTATETTSTTGAVECGDPIYVDVPATADAFFISGSTDQGTSCNYYGGVPGGPQPACAPRNFGATGALQLAKADDNVEGMYAVRFSEADLNALQANNVQVELAELHLTGWGLVEVPLYLEVGMIAEQWAEGGANGTLAVMGDSSYVSPNGGMGEQWVGGDGPRGGSEWAADLFVEVPVDDHFPLISDVFPVGADYVEQLSLRGLVVSYPLETELYTYGPGIKSHESIVEYWPFLRVYGCLPP
jgi:hypothetical protein